MDNRSLKKFLLIVSLLSLSLPAFSDEADNILGMWLTAEGKSKVEIYKCSDKYCGKIVWLKIPQYPLDDPQGMGGKDKVDRENPDGGLKTRPLLGINVIQGFIYDGESEWDDGTIYDPRNGKTYNCKMTLTDENTLEVRGYVGLPLFGRTAVWTRTKGEPVAAPVMPGESAPAAEPAASGEAAPTNEPATSGEAPPMSE